MKEKFQQLDKNKKIVFFAIIPFILIILVVIIVLFSTLITNEEKELDINPFKNLSTEVIGIDNEKSKIISSKTEAYRLNAARENKGLDDTIISLLSPHELLLYNKEKEKEITEAEEEELARVQSNIDLMLGKKTETKPKEKKKQNPYRRKQTNTKSSANKTAKVTAEVWGYGEENISVNSFDDSDISNDNIEAQVFYEGTYLDKNMKIKHNSQLTFILQDDMTIKGVNFKKMSKLYAIARYSSNAIEIQVNTIKNARDGKSYPVNLIGYNEHYQEGIYYEGKIENAKRKGKNSAIDEMADEYDYQSGSVTGGLISSGINATQEMVKKDVKEYEIKEGYKMYFAYEND